MLEVMATVLLTFVKANTGSCTDINRNVLRELRTTTIYVFCPVVVPRVLGVRFSCARGEYPKKEVALN